MKQPKNAPTATTISTFERKAILEEVKRQLRYQPTVETRNRKMLRGEPGGRWELRIGRYRVFYGVTDDTSTVSVGAVGFKEHNILYIRGKEVRL